ncbi:MAG: tetratricopeptide repeat protein, partial [Armatimonadetes bacterium]|nr:tetratricopeptide repeat protein [Armatimonadota bacterium]NIM23031.1 tetratricopeptide repeat protein [Armatimonadota bacterium]NIM66899.1 tetratricopeptide repeat protein [Armatimonadota bacterium]NIM75433.1 tetratricopeptide repeat protein [Armatimonadota bacterium]NIN05090.1 tetratricopeptide repeat protein [Armatimonadota bacterium]
RFDAGKMIGLALCRGGLLAAVFLAPIVWARFDGLGAAVVLSCLCLGGIGFMISKPERLLPAGLPLSSFHLALAALVLVSLVSYFSSLSTFASGLDLVRLAAGALVFWLALWAGAEGEVQNSEVRVESNAATRPRKSKRASRQTRKNLQPALTAIFFMILVAAGCVVHDWFSYYDTPAQVMLLLALIAVGSLLIFAYLWARPAGIDTISVALVATGIVALYGIHEWLNVRFVVGNETWQVFSTFYNPNPLAGFLGMALFLSLGAPGCAIIAKRGAARSHFFPIITAILILACLPFTYSKGAWASLYLAGAVWLILLALILSTSRLKKAVLIGLILAVMFAAPVGLSFARPGLQAKARTALSLKNRSNMFRYLTWKASLEMAAGYPWTGVGAGAFEYGFGQYAIAGYTRRAHQNYLETAAELGWPGLFCFVWLLAAGIVGLGRAVKRAQNGEKKILAAGALCASLVMIFHSFLDYDWYIGANMTFFFLACGLGISAGSGAAADAGKGKMRIGWRVTAVVFFLLLAAKAVTLGWADREYRAAQESTRKGLFLEARSHLQRAVRLAPDFGRAYWKLASLSPSQESISLLEKAASLEPKYPVYPASLGRMRKEAGDLEGALSAYRETTALNPQQLNAWISIAEINLTLGRREEAIEAFQHIIEIQQGPAGRYQAIEYEVKIEYAEAHYAMAVVLSNGVIEGGEETAMEHLQEAVRLLKKYERVGRMFTEQRRVIGEAAPGIEDKVALLKGKCYFRMAGILRGRGEQAEADEMLASAMEVRSDIARIVAAEDLEWLK